MKRLFVDVTLALLLLVEVAAIVALGWVGSRIGAFPLNLWAVVLLPAIAIGAWGRYAAPNARHRGPLVTPAVKVLVFGAAVVGLWGAYADDWAKALLVASVVINALVLTPPVRGVQRALASPR